MNRPSVSPLAARLPGSAALGRLLAVVLAISALVLVAGTTQAAPRPHGALSTDCPVDEYAMGLRYQQSGNAAAAQRQAWLLATLRLREIVRKGSGGGKPPAVVTDLDETVLDNTALLARDLEACHDYTTWDTWSDWEINGNPLITPGTRRFLSYADKHHIAIYYISDRYSENIASTMASMRELGLPQVRRSHVLLYGLTKEERRAKVAEDHKIVMLLGDSLPDFAASYVGATPEQQHALVKQDAAHWGRDWIMFPNAAYGKWSGATLRAWDAPLP